MRFHFNILKKDVLDAVPRKSQAYRRKEDALVSRPKHHPIEDVDGDRDW